MIDVRKALQAEAELAAMTMAVLRECGDYDDLAAVDQAELRMLAAIAAEENFIAEQKQWHERWSGRVCDLVYKNALGDTDVELVRVVAVSASGVWRVAQPGAGVFCLGNLTTKVGTGRCWLYHRPTGETCEFMYLDTNEPGDERPHKAGS